MQVRLGPPGPAQHVGVQIMLPGRSRWVDFGQLRVVSEVLEIPVSLCFLSHAREDETEVAGVGDRLEEDGIVTWFSPKGIKGGADWKSEIDDAIRSADFVAIFLSRHSISKKGYFQREVKRAFDLREELPDGERFIIPVLLEDITPPSRYEDIQWVRLYEADGYERLKQTLGDLSVPS